MHGLPVLSAILEDVVNGQKCRFGFAATFTRMAVCFQDLLPEFTPMPVLVFPSGFSIFPCGQQKTFPVILVIERVVLGDPSLLSALNYLPQLLAFMANVARLRSAGSEEFLAASSLSSGICSP